MRMEYRDKLGCHAMVNPLHSLKLDFWALHKGQHGALQHIAYVRRQCYSLGT